MVVYKVRLQDGRTIHMIGELHNEVLAGDFLHKFCNDLKARRWSRPRLLIEFRPFEKVDLIEKDEVAEFLEKAPHRISPVLFFSLCISSDIHIGNEELIPYDMRLEQVRDIGGQLNEDILNDNNTRWEWFSDMANAWKEQLNLFPFPPTFTTLVHLWMSRLHWLLQQPQLDTDALGVAIDAQHDLFTAVADISLVNEINNTTADDDVFVFLGRDHIFDTLNRLQRQDGDEDALVTVSETSLW